MIKLGYAAYASYFTSDFDENNFFLIENPIFAPPNSRFFG